MKQMGSGKVEKNPELKIKTQNERISNGKGRGYIGHVPGLPTPYSLFLLFITFLLGCVSSLCIYRAPNTGFSSAPVFREKINKHKLI